jgi:hypothetical protein
MLLVLMFLILLLLLLLPMLPLLITVTAGIVEAESRGGNVTLIALDASTMLEGLWALEGACE